MSSNVKRKLIVSGLPKLMLINSYTTFRPYWVFFRFFIIIAHDVLLTLFLYLAQSEKESGSASSNSITAAVVVVVTGLGCMLLTALVIIYFKRRRSRKIVL